MKKLGRGLAQPLGSVLARLGVSPDAITIAGLVFAAACGLALAGGRWGLAFLLLVASALSDLLDGAVARMSEGRDRTMGATLDSTVDRYAEALVLGGVLVHAVRHEAGDLFVWLWVLALTGSFLTSYVRARAEGLGLSCEVGIMERPERIALLGLLCLIGPRSAIWILAILAAGSHVTFLQRLVHVHRSVRPDGKQGP
jgi:CDP-diacylglycerol--glycerol-3-phosphate 3-phosphatidyltransferase